MTRSYPRRRWRRGPCRLSYGCRYGDRSSDWRSCAHLLANFRSMSVLCGRCDPQHLVEALSMAPNVLHVERAPHLPPISTHLDHAAQAQHAHVPADAGLAHAQVLCELGDVHLADLAQALQDPQARGVGEPQEVV